MSDKRHDLFIAYHGTFNAGGTRDKALALYDFLKQKDPSLDIFFFPVSGQRNYQRNIAEVMASKEFIFVAGPSLKLTQFGKIDPSVHYELLMEIDSFYCLTLSDETTKAEDALLIGTDGFNAGISSDIHPLFNGLSQLQIENGNEEEGFEKAYRWLKTRLQKDRGSAYLSQSESNEVYKVFRRRSQAFEAMDFTSRVAASKSIKAIGISISELTKRFDDTEPLEQALHNGSKFELLFLDPDSKQNADREEEERTIDKGEIAAATRSNVRKMLRLRSSLEPEVRKNLVMRYYRAVPRLNFIQVDDVSFLQYYGNFAKGLTNPCFVLLKRDGGNPLLEYCLKLFGILESESTEVVE